MNERTLFYNAALREALFEEMERDSSVIVMGEDVARYGGIYRVTEGLQQKFGPARVRDTAISEAAIVGAGIGAAIQGLRPVVEIMYADFLPIAMDQIVNQASTMYFVTGGEICVPLVIRTQGGVGFSGGIHHSKNLEAWLTHIPGIKVVAPATPYDAKGLLKSAVRDNNPVVFLEHKLLYGTTGPVPEGEYSLLIGRAEVKRSGRDVTIIAWSRMVLEALVAAEELAEAGIQAEVIDLRTLSPLDEDTIYESVRRTNRAIVVHEAWKTSGFGAEIAAWIQEYAFNSLDGPVVRIGGLDTPIPFSPPLRDSSIPHAADIVKVVKETVRIA